jgi:hypothetical protein
MLRSLVSVIAKDVILIVGSVTGVVRFADLVGYSDEVDLDRVRELYQGPPDVVHHPAQQTFRTGSRYPALERRGCNGRCLHRSCLEGVAWFPVACQHSSILS